MTKNKNTDKLIDYTIFKKSTKNKIVILTCSEKNENFFNLLID